MIRIEDVVTTTVALGEPRITMLENIMAEMAQLLIAQLPHIILREDHLEDEVEVP